MATNRFYTDSTGQKKQEAEFHNVVTFGKLADIASKYLTKGGLILVEGRIKTASWQGSDGVKKYRTEIIAESLQLGPRPQGTGMPSAKPYQAPQNNTVKPFGATQGGTEEIPIIEENYTPPATDSHSNLPDSFDTTEDKNSDEIDVKDIPF